MFQFLNRRKQRERIRHEAEVALLTQQRDRALELVRTPRAESDLDLRLEAIRGALVVELERLDVYLDDDMKPELIAELELVRSLAAIAIQATEQVDDLEAMERAIVKQNEDQVRILQSLLAVSEENRADLVDWRYAIIRSSLSIHATPDSIELLNLVQAAPQGFRDRQVAS